MIPKCSNCGSEGGGCDECGPGTTVELPRAEYERLLDAERIAWALANGIERNDQEPSLRPFISWYVYGSPFEISYLGDDCWALSVHYQTKIENNRCKYLGNGDVPVLNSEARAIIDAARRGEAAP